MEGAQLEAREQQDRLLEQMGRLKAEHKEKVEGLLREHVEETRNLTGSFSQARQLLQEQLDQSKESAREWEARYARRESRQEDVSELLALRKQVGSVIASSVEACYLCASPSLKP